MGNCVKQSLERILESAAVVSWPDLMHGAQTGLVHIEYAFVAGGTVDSLKVWVSLTRGQWLLACEYWMSANTFHAAGVCFHNGYRSDGLAHILEAVMQHQTAFFLPTDLGRQGLLQVPPPTEDERAAAASSVDEALGTIGSALALPAVA